MVKWYLLIGLILIPFLIVSHVPIFASDFNSIENPKPTIMETEKHYVQLEQVKTIDADLGNGEYLFRPFSVTACQSSSDVFIYDNLQARLFKMNPELQVVKSSFGSKGTGPAEFGGTGKGYPVYIHMGRDKKLYANDSRMRKIIVFDENGKYIREFKNQVTSLKEPLVDSSGNLYIMTVKNKIISVHDEKNALLFTLSNQDENFNYLFSTPGPFYLKMASQYLETELSTALTVGSRFLLYFQSSSTMVIVEEKKFSKQIRLWPHEALNNYKMKLANVRKRTQDIFIPLFSNLFVDEDNDDVFFLQFGRDEKKGINTLYQFNDKGELMKILYVKVEEKSPLIHFKLKKNNGYYAIVGDKIALYKETKIK